MENKATRKENFFNMSVGSRTQYIWLYGTYAMSREYLNYTIALYEIGGFFAEVWYSETMDEVERIEVIDDLSGLDNYLAYIDISNLIN